VAGGPSLVIDWRPRGWLDVGVEGRLTAQLFAAEDPFSSTSTQLLLRAGATF
jgi:hypothetical protein